MPWLGSAGSAHLIRKFRFAASSSPIRAPLLADTYTNGRPRARACSSAWV